MLHTVIMCMCFLQSKDHEIVALLEKVSAKDSELALRDNDLRDVINRHEQEVKRLASKADVNMQDELLQVMEQKVKDVNDVLDSKLKVIQMLQSDLGIKDKALADKDSDFKLMQEKLAVTSEQVRILQDTLTSTEAQWKKEKQTYEQLARETPAASRSSDADSSAHIEQLTASVKQYESAYQQLSAQHSALQQEYTRMSNSAAEQQSQPLDLQAVQEELKAKSDKIEVLEKQLSSAEPGASAESASGGGKPDAKFLKYKAQTTAKIKNLEKQIEQLKKVACVSCVCSYMYIRISARFVCSSA